MKTKKISAFGWFLITLILLSFFGSWERVCDDTYTGPFGDEHCDYSKRWVWIWEYNPYK